jgi:hypothetical protein
VQKEILSDDELGKLIDDQDAAAQRKPFGHKVISKKAVSSEQ